MTLAGGIAEKFQFSIVDDWVFDIGYWFISVFIYSG